MSKMKINTYELSIEENMALIPDLFYKYCKIDKYFKKNIKKGQLWFNSPANFNDPFDCKAYIDFGNSEKQCRENFERFNDAFKVKLPKKHKEIWDELLKNPDDFNLLNSYGAINNFKEWLGVTCFSEDHDNTIMWSHYADSHKGLVLEFKKDLSGFITQNLLPVIYYKKYPEINVSDYEKDQMISVAYQIICAKGINWEYENEWRAISVPGNKLYSFNKNELSGIIFGLETEECIKKKVYNLINKSGYSDIKFKQAEFNEREFTVKYVEYKPE